MRYSSDRKPYEPGQHNEVIDDAQYRNEVGNEIQRRQRICSRTHVIFISYAQQYVYIWDRLREARLHTQAKHIRQLDKATAASEMGQPRQVHAQAAKGMHSSAAAQREHRQ